MISISTGPKSWLATKMAVGTALLLATCVAAFVHHSAAHHRRPFTLAAKPPPSSDVAELKSLLQSSDYNSDIVQAYRKGRVNVKTVPETTPASSVKYEYDVPATGGSTSSTAATGQPLSPVPETPPPSVPETPPVTAAPDLGGAAEGAATASSSSGGGSGVEGGAIPSEVADSLSRPFAPLNDFLKTTKESIAATTTQQQASRSLPPPPPETAAAGAAPAKVPTLADYIGRSLMDRKAELSTATEKGGMELNLPDMKAPDFGDIKVPDIKMPSMRMPDVKMPEFRGPPVGSFGGTLGGAGVSPPEPGRALPLGDFLKATASGVDSTSASAGTSALENARIKLGIMAANFYNLIGREPPEGLADRPIDLPDFSAFSFTDLVERLTELQAGLPERAPWIAVAVGATLVVLGARRDDDAKATAAADADIQKTSAALGGLTGELGTLQSRMKALEGTGMDLNGQLLAAMEKLTEKELEISKERLKGADSSLAMGRKIDTLERKLKENDRQVRALDKELEKTRKECEALQRQLEKAEAEQLAAMAAADEAKAKNEIAVTKLGEAPFFVKVAKPAPASAPVVKEEPKPAPTTTVSSKAKSVSKVTTKVETEDLATATVDDALPKKKATKKQTANAPAAEKEELPAAPKAEAEPTPKKKAAPKQVGAKTKARAVANIEDLPSAEAETPKKKAASKVVAAKTILQAVAEIEDMPAASETETEPTPKKKAASKGGAAKTKAPAVAETEDLPSVVLEPVASLEKNGTNAVLKKPPAKKASVDGDLSKLSKSTLSKKTVKELKEYLESKGISTTGDDGKQLSKAGMVDAVLSF